MSNWGTVLKLWKTSSYFFLCGQYLLIMKLHRMERFSLDSGAHGGEADIEA